MRRWPRRIGLAVLGLFAFFVLTNWPYLMAFPGILPSFYAKEFCSCRYVMGQDVDYCHAYATQYIPISDFKLDETTRTVTVRATGATRTARWLSPREGCRLDP